LIREPEILRRKFSELLNRGKAKRREQILLSLAFYALAMSLLILPFHSLLPAGISRWWIPPLVFFGCAPFVFFKKRWRPQDATRAVAQADKSLRLEERAITAWEILARSERSAAEDLVVTQTEERFKAVDVKSLCQRPYDWQAYLILPLFIAWLALVSLDTGVVVNGGLRLPAPQSLAYKLREFSRELQLKAEDEGLRATMQFGRELEKTAQQGIDTKASDERFKSELAGMTNRFDAMRRAAPESPSFSAAESQQALKDLKTELEAARDLLNFPNGQENQLGQQWLDRLAGLPQLKRQFDKRDPVGQKLSQSELKSFLDRLENQVSGELDRRALLDAQQFLDQLMKQGQGQQGENNVQMAGQGKDDLPDDGERAKSNLPGNEPGKKGKVEQPFAQFPAGATTHLKGLLGEGQSSGLGLKGKPSAGKTEISQEEVVASYRRQAEVELNSERVPEALKEIIRNYFLSLKGQNEKQEEGNKETRTMRR
jgi:hypothetical protein